MSDSSYAEGVVCVYIQCVPLCTSGEDSPEEVQLAAPQLGQEI